MASARYTRNITPDVPEPPHEMTRKEKLANHWYYYKWYYLIGAAVLLAASLFVHDLVSQVKPDYSVAILSGKALPDVATEALSAALSPLADDLNGDGRCVVEVVQYTLPLGDDETAADAYTVMAGSTKLAADAQAGTSMIWLCDAPAVYQVDHPVFAYNDGTVPPENGPYDEAQLGFAWGDCPALTALDLGTWPGWDGKSEQAVQDLFSDFVILRRARGDNESQTTYYESSMQLFQKLTTKEAIS